MRLCGKAIEKVERTIEKGECVRLFIGICWYLMWSATTEEVVVLGWTFNIDIQRGQTENDKHFSLFTPSTSFF